MKRLFFLFLFVTRTLFGLYCGNPSSPSLIEEGFFFSKENSVCVKVGYQRDWVIDRNMKVVNYFTGRMDTFSYLADQGVLLVNLIDRFEVYGSVGAAAFNLTHNPFNNVRNEYQTHNQFFWGMGLRALAYSWKKVSLGIDLAYGRGQPTVRWMTSNGVPTAPRAGSKLNFHEWQVGVGASYQVAIFYPYIVAKYANATGRLKHLTPNFIPGTRHFNMKNRRKFGMALGCSLSSTDRFSLTIESRLIDEEAVTLAGEVKF